MVRGRPMIVSGGSPLPPQNHFELNAEQLDELAELVYRGKVALQGQAVRDFPRNEELCLMSDTLLAVSNALHHYSIGRLDSLEHAKYFERKYQEAILKREQREGKLNESPSRFC
jgi:hypothetical protein